MYCYSNSLPLLFTQITMNSQSDHKSNCRLEELMDLDEHKTRVHYLKGENIFKQGAFSPHIIYVVKGLIKIYLHTDPGRQINIGISKSGDFLSFSSVFNEQVHTYSAQAITESEICMIERDSLKEILLKSPEFAFEITARNYRNEKQLLEVINNVSYKQMRAKLASALLYLSQKDFLAEKIFLHLNRKDIADFASIAQESAIKFLKEFERDGLIHLDGKDVIIKNIQGLMEINTRG